MIEPTDIMAAINFAPVSMRLPELSSRNGNTFRSSLILKKRPVVSVPIAASSSESSTSVPEKPEIELEFIGVGKTRMPKLNV